MQGDADAFEIDEQGIGPGVVRAQRLFVEFFRVVQRQRKLAAIEHQIALDVVQAARPQLPQKKPELFQGETWIAAAAQVQRPVQPPVHRRVFRQRLGLPGMGRAEDVERGVGTYQLHDRSRIHRRVHVVADQRRFFIHLLYQHGDLVRGDSGPGERLGDRRGKPRGQRPAKRQKAA